MSEANVATAKSYSCTTLDEVAKALDEFQFSRALDAIFGFLGDLDRFIQHYEPFKLIKTDKEKALAVLWHSAYGACAIADMLRPFLPGTSEKIFSLF